MANSGRTAVPWRTPRPSSTWRLRSRMEPQDATAHHVWRNRGRAASVSAGWRCVPQPGTNPTPEAIDRERTAHDQRPRDSSSCAQAPRALCAASMHASGKRERRYACRFSMRKPSLRRGADRSPAASRCAAEFPRPGALQYGAALGTRSCGLPKRPQIQLVPIKGMRIVPLSVTVQGFAAARAR